MFTRFWRDFVIALYGFGKMLEGFGKGLGGFWEVEALLFACFGRRGYLMVYASAARPFLFVQR